MKKYFSLRDFNVCIKECQDKNKIQKVRALFLYRVEKKSAKDVALSVGTTIGNIYQWAHKYKKNGAESFESKPKGGRKHAIMTLAEEEAVLNEVANDGKKGLVVIANEIQKNIEKRASRPVFKNYAYSLLRRHKWRKIKPRPKNPKSSKDAQEEFKKNFSSSVAEIEKTFDPQDKRPIKVLAQDEGRFGRINTPKRCWAPKGIRPTVPAQRVRQFLYVFSVVCPLTGSNFSLIFSDADTAIMNIFLTKVSQHYKNYRLIILADQASWHKSKELKKFNNIRFLYLPAGSPELNPAEHLWEHLREKHFANQVFDSIKDVQCLLIKGCKEMYYNPDAIQSLVSFSWIKLNFNH